MNIESNTILPLSSGDDLLNLFQCYLDAFGGDIPLSEQIDVFNSDGGNKFDLYTQTNKFLGEDVFILSSSNLESENTTLTRTLTSGQNGFNPFDFISDGVSLQIPLSSTNLIENGATAGSTLETADVIWQFVDGNVEGAWLKDSSNEFLVDDACIRLERGSNELKFPYPDRGVSGEGLEWTGKGINNCNTTLYLSQDDQIINDIVQDLYWSDDSSDMFASPISIHQTTLIDLGATASRDITEADQITVRPTRDSELESFTWLFEFNRTEIPITCGFNNIHYPLFKLTDEVDSPFNINTDQVESKPLSSINILQEMSGAVAGTIPNTADQIYKQAKSCGSDIEGAWLSGCPITDITQSLSGDIINVEDVVPFLMIEMLTSGTIGYQVFINNIPTLLIDARQPDLLPDLFSFVDYRYEIIDNIFTAHWIFGASTEVSRSWTLSIDGTDLVFTETNKQFPQIASVDISTTLSNNMLLTKEIQGSARQVGLHMLAKPNETTHFVWEFPNKDATLVINGYEHDSYCDYLEINDYTSNIDPSVNEETNQWEQCNCKAVYFSPIGHDLDFDTNQEFIDVIYLDSGVEPFSLATWEDEDGNDYINSDQFAVFRYKGLEPDAGFGIGFWETLKGDPLILQKGKSYVYKRAGFGGCADNSTPQFVVNNNACYDRPHPNICYPVWIKLVQNTEGVWVSTGEPTDMTLDAGDFFRYVKQATIEYELKKHDLTYNRITTTPSFSLNISFNNARPYWAVSENIRGYNVGLYPRITDSYLLTTQPDPSDIILTDDLYVNYERVSCDVLEWIQPVELTVDLNIPQRWNKIEFNNDSPDLLRKITGCGSCEMIFDDSPNSCYLRQNKCDVYFTSIKATDEPSDMILRNPVNCGEETNIEYFAQSTLTWEQTFNVVTTSSTNNISTLFVSAKEPWKNIFNTNQPIIKIHEQNELLKTKGEIGIFKPENLGISKLECFGKTFDI